MQPVYVASPNSEHLVHALLAIGAGKRILVEKAFTRSAEEAGQVFDAARAASVFVMEAMWTRFLPHVAALREVLARGEIGDVVGLIADHGQNMGHLPDAHRLHNPELAGGALPDLGVYPVSFAHDLLGVPDRVRALGSPTPTGVDGQVSVALGVRWACTGLTAHHAVGPHPDHGRRLRIRGSDRSRRGVLCPNHL